MLQLVSILEVVHNSRYIHNDLKPDNIMLSFQGDNVKVNLIDFGYAKRYFHSSTGPIRADTKVESFQGNFLFGSLNQLKFKPTSRVDDINSLLYIMLYLFNDGDLPGLKKFLGDDGQDVEDSPKIANQLFHLMTKYKQ